MPLLGERVLPKLHDIDSPICCSLIENAPIHTKLLDCCTLYTSTDMEFPFDCPETISAGEISDHVEALSDHIEPIRHHTDPASDKAEPTFGHSISHELSGTESFNDKLCFESSQIVDTILTPNESVYAVRQPP